MAAPNPAASMKMNALIASARPRRTEGLIDKLRGTGTLGADRGERLRDQMARMSTQSRSVTKKPLLSPTTRSTRSLRKPVTSASRPRPWTDPCRPCASHRARAGLVRWWSSAPGAPAPRAAEHGRRDEGRAGRPSRDTCPSPGCPARLAPLTHTSHPPQKEKRRNVESRCTTTGS